MYYEAVFRLITCVVVFCRMFTVNEASLKWEIKTKPLEIGKEARLSCYDNNCPPTNTRRWLGGKHYGLLCFDGESKQPLKYEMTSNGTAFDLMIKNFTFTDVNCEYTCACGYQQYTKMLKVKEEELIYPPKLQKNSITQENGKLHIDVSIEVHPSPNCIILYKEQILHTNISVRKMSDEGDLTLYEVSIQHTVEQNGGTSTGSIKLNCKVGSKVYSMLLFTPDSVEDEDKPKSAIPVIIGLLTGISFIIVLTGLRCIYKRQKKVKEHQILK